MMAVVSSTPDRPPQPMPAVQMQRDPYVGLTIRAKEGQIRVVSILFKTDLVYYTINGVGMHHKTQDEFRKAFMTPTPPPAPVN